MATKVFTHINLLAGTHEQCSFIRGNKLKKLPVIKNAYLVVEEDHIAEIGEMENCKYHGARIDVGTIVIPAWCDSHTHLVFATSREEEFIDKINGLTYAEIAEKGGGILNSAQKLNDATEDELFIQAWKRLSEIRAMGTGAVEIKSGYGLSLEGELKMLRVIKRLKEKSDLKIKSTFLGAHAFPNEYKNDHKGYIQLIIEEMLPQIAKEHLADYVDAFCENGFFNPEEMSKVCNAAKSLGLKPKLHVNQLNSIGGIEAGIQLGALSLDHLETLTDSDISQLGKFNGASTLLPTAAYFLRMPMPPARALINAGAAVTLASDYNPGSSPSGNMNLVHSMSCIQMKMLPEEAINAATINGSCAMEIEKDYGSITVGKKANLIFTKPVPSLAYLSYAFGSDHIENVMINGNFIS
ncbi:MAG: imidazolonepropionase [Ginsengibacter sp.]